MPVADPRRVTPLQVLALMAIWAAALYGLLTPPPTRDARPVAAKIAPDAATCSRLFREG